MTSSQLVRLVAILLMLTTPTPLVSAAVTSRRESTPLYDGEYENVYSGEAEDYHDRRLDAALQGGTVAGSSEQLVIPDIYYVSEKLARHGTHPETEVDGVVYKQVDLSDDVMRFGLNRKIHLEDYMEPPGSRMNLVVKDLQDVAPFGVQVNPKRKVVFLVDNKRVQRYFKRERKNLLQLALTIDPTNRDVAHAFYYRLSMALDEDTRRRRAFLRKVIRNLARNDVLPQDLTVRQIEHNLTDSQLLEFTHREYGLRPYVESEFDERGNRFYPAHLTQPRPPVSKSGGTVSRDKRVE